MADSRTTGLDPITLTQLNTLKATIKFIIDDPSFTTAKGLALLDLLRTTRIINSDSGIDYQAITPKSFFESLMDETNFGIGRMADDAAIAGKYGDGLIRSGKLDKVLSLVENEWFLGASPSDLGAYRVTSQANNTPAAMVFPSCYAGSLLAANRIVLSPALPTGVYFDAGRITGTIQTDQKTGSFDFEYPRVSPGAEYSKEVAGAFFIYLTSTRTELKLRSTAGDQTNCRLAATCHFTTRT